MRIWGTVFVVGLMTLAGSLHSFVYPGHRWTISTVPYYVNVDGLNGLMTAGQAVQELQDAAANWTTQAQIPFRFAYMGTTTATAWGGGTYAKPVRDNLNVIDLVASDESGNSGENVYIWWNGSGAIVETGMRFRYGAYPYFPDGVLCAGGYYLEDFATHAFGHWLQLEHPPSGPSVMQPVNGAGNCDGQRTLQADDIAGARYIYGTTAPTPEVSPDGSTVPPLTEIVDSQGAIWTIGSTNVILRNGTQAGNGLGSQIYWYANVIYVFGTDSHWWGWTGTGWIDVGPTQPGPPPPPSGETSPDGTQVPPASSIVDASGAVWTIGSPNVILRNGSQAGNGLGSTILWSASTIYVYGTDSNWWQWTGSSWTNVGPVKPGSGGTASPNGTSVPPATQIIDNLGFTWTIGSPNVIVRNGTQASGGYGSEIYWTASTINVFGTDGNWWRWTGTGWTNIGPVRP